MKNSPIRTSESKTSAYKKGEVSDRRSLQVTLTEAEREVLLKAIKRYQHTIPSYIRSNQAEIRLADAIIQKLS